jgi:plasmid stabilization system protein ParE
MRYTVTWLPNAENELADIWNRAKDKRSVTAASNHIDRELKNNPQDKALFLDPDWAYIEPPLAVVFQILEDDRKVDITQVWFRE